MLRLLCRMGFHRLMPVRREVLGGVIVNTRMRCTRCGMECLTGLFTGHLRCP